MIDLFASEPTGQIIGGIVEMRDGTRYYSFLVQPNKDGFASVRIESGEYATYTRDGRLCYKTAGSYQPYGTECLMDIVDFIRCDWADPKASNLEADYYAAKRRKDRQEELYGAIS